MSAYLKTLGLHVYLATTKKSYLGNDKYLEANDYSSILHIYCHILIFIFNKTLLFDLFLLSDVQTFIKRRKTGKEPKKPKKPNKFRDLRQSYLQIERKI